MLLAFSAYVLIALSIALIGGGWLALRRIDPLLVVPGLGWASLALAAAPPAAPAGRLAALAAMALIVCLGLLALLLSGQWPLLQLLLTATIAMLLGSAAIAGSRRIDRALTRPSVRRATAVVCGLMLGLCVQQLGWIIISPLYQLHDRRHDVSDAGRDPLPATRLVTALPLVTLDDPRRLLTGASTASPMLVELDHVTSIYRVDRASDGELRRTTSLILAHPPAMPPEDIVAVDAFVRRGGAVLILADGLLSWPPPYPLGDPRNPPITSLMTPLLDHWGIALDAPAGLRQELVHVYDGSIRLALFSPGRLRVAAGSPCQVRLDGLMATCRIGRGRATIIADADLLNDAHWQPDARSFRRTSANWRADNARWISRELAETAGFAEPRAWVRPVWVR